MPDLFNNPNNDYVYPALSPCAGTPDDAYLEFTETGIGIVSGSKILANINFSDLKIPVAAYSTETKILQEGEVIYITGLTKGLTARVQVFTMPISPSLVTTNEDSDPYFLNIDLSINYYKNFKYTYTNIDVSADYAESITIENALNTALGAAGINATATYDPSNFSFRGSLDGYDFNVSNVNLSIVNTSDNTSSPFAFGANDVSYNLAEDVSARVSYAKYPNSAMQGIAMKSVYAESTTYDPYDHWLYINHVSNLVTIYEPITLDNFIAEASTYLHIGFDPSTAIGCGILNPSTLYDVSIAYNDVSNGFLFSDLFLEGIVIEDSSVIDCSVNNSSADNSNIIDSFLSETSIYHSVTNDCSITDSSISLTLINETSFEECTINDSSIMGGSIINNNSIVNNSVIVNSWTNIDTSSLTVEISNSEIWDSSINNTDIVDCSIVRCFLENVSISGCTLYNTALDSSFYVSILDDNRIVMIDPSIANIIELTYDSSTYYEKVIKTLDVGMNGSSTITTMSAGDYLNWVTVNNYWNKFGELYSWVSAADGTTTENLTNLINGFYVYNPHTFNIKIEYILFV